MYKRNIFMMKSNIEEIIGATPNSPKNPHNSIQ